MLNTEEIYNLIIGLLPGENSDESSYFIGNGILTNRRIGFDIEKLEESKPKIASILHELEIDQGLLTSLENFTTDKNGETWNQLKNIKDFKTLELLIAVSDACDFIHNDVETIQRNINEIGDINSILIFPMGRTLVGNDDLWLSLMKKNVINRMYFLTEPSNIKLYLDKYNKLKLINDK